MSKNSIFLMIAAVLLLCGSCALVTGLNEVTLAYDANGHVTKDAKYSLVNAVFTYKADGTYEELHRSYNSTSDQFETTSGTRGTYTYDTKTTTLTLSVGDYFDVTDSSWKNAKDNGAITTIKKCFVFTDHSIYKAYTGSASNGVFTATGSYEYDDGGVFDDTYEFDIGTNIESLSYTMTRKNTWPNGTVVSDPTYTYKYTDTFTIDRVTPESITHLTPGATFSVHMVKVNEKTYDWATDGFSTTASSDTNFAQASPYNFVLSPDGTQLLYNMNGGQDVSRSLH